MNQPTISAQDRYCVGTKYLLEADAAGDLIGNWTAQTPLNANNANTVIFDSPGSPTTYVSVGAEDVYFFRWVGCK